MTQENEPHTHKCGFTLFQTGTEAANAQYGCGHEWSHSRNELEATNSFEKGHVCPSCGLGPWVWQFCPETVARREELARDPYLAELERARESLFDFLAGAF